MPNTVTREDTLIQELLDTTIGDPCKLVVHNDDVNTFDWIIQSLVEICQHNLQQAEQCAMIIHFKGKYAVKEGGEAILKPMRVGLSDRGIGATLEYC